jgi:hypothetical protein
VKKNELVNFVKQYKNTVCLNSCLKPIKVVDCLEEDSQLYCQVVLEGGEKSKVSSQDRIIPLKGRIKERDYNFIEALFNRTLH